MAMGRVILEHDRPSEDAGSTGADDPELFLGSVCSHIPDREGDPFREML
jgi:hypothetical protein